MGRRGAPETGPLVFAGCSAGWYTVGVSTLEVYLSATPVGVSWLSPTAARWLAVVGMVLGVVATGLLSQGVGLEVAGLVVVAGCVLAALGGYKLPVPPWARGRPLVPAGVVGVVAAVEWWAPLLSGLLPVEGRELVAALLPVLAVALGKVSDAGHPLPGVEEASALLASAKPQPSSPAAIGPAAALHAAAQRLHERSERLEGLQEEEARKLVQEHGGNVARALAAELRGMSYELAAESRKAKP